MLPAVARSRLVPSGVSGVLPRRRSVGRLLRMHPNYPGIGEVCKFSDWCKFPGSGRVRVVALVIRDKDVIR